MKIDTGKVLSGPGSPLLALLVGMPLSVLCGFLTANTGSAFLGFGLLFSFVLPLVICLLTRRFLLLLAPLVNMALVYSFLYFLTREKDALYLSTETGKNTFVFYSCGPVAIAFAIACAYRFVPTASSPTASH